MIQKDIIRMALEAGMTTMAHDSRIARFASLIAASEREACAKVCEGIGDGNKWSDAHDCAAAIRARSKT